MNCPNCGKEISDGDRFCPSCGYKLSDTEIEEGVRASQADEDGFSNDPQPLGTPGELDPSVTQVIDDIHNELGTEDPYHTYRSARAREFGERRDEERRNMNYDGPNDMGNPGGGYGSDQPDLGQSDQGQPDFGQSDQGQPDFGQPDYGQPDRGQPNFDQPDFGGGDYRGEIHDDFRRRSNRDEYEDPRRRNNRDEYEDSRRRNNRDEYEDPRRRDDRNSYNYQYADRRDRRGGRKKDGGLIALIIILIAVVVVAAVLILMLIRNRNKAAEDLTQVKLDKYLSVQLTETDEGSGTYTAEATFNSTAFEDKYGAVIVFEGTSSDRKKLAPDAKSDAELLAKSCIQGSLDKSEDLTDGDTVTFKWNCDNDTAAEYFGIELVYTDQTFEVSDLIADMPKVEIATSSAEEADEEVSSESEENPAIQNAEYEASDAVALVWNGSLIGTRDQYNQAKALTDSLPDSSEVKKELEDELAQADAALTEQEEAAKAAAEEEARKAAEEEAARKAEEEQAQTQQAQQATDASGQLFPQSSSQQISQDQISSLSDNQLQESINELYARHGYAFKDPAIRAYFEQFSWYNPTVDDMKSITFNSTEQDNLKRLSAERSARSNE